jgi:hypothetical protein
LERSKNPVYGAEGSFIEWKKVFLFAGVDGDYTCFPAIGAMNSSGQNQSN